ncbi:hypothetical protein D3C84_988940 [compost metagenome]
MRRYNLFISRYRLRRLSRIANVAMRSTLVWNSSWGRPSLNWLAMSRPCCWVQALRLASKAPAINGRRTFRSKRTRNGSTIGTGWEAACQRLMPGGTMFGQMLMARPR